METFYSSGCQGHCYGWFLLSRFQCKHAKVNSGACWVLLFLFFAKTHQVYIFDYSVLYISIFLSTLWWCLWVNSTLHSLFVSFSWGYIFSDFHLFVREYYAVLCHFSPAALAKVTLRFLIMLSPPDSKCYLYWCWIWCVCKYCVCVC